MAAEAILAVSSVVVNTGIKASIDMLFATILFSLAFFHREVLVGTEVLDHFELIFKFLKLEEFFVVHLLLIK